MESMVIGARMYPRQLAKRGHTVVREGHDREEHDEHVRENCGRKGPKTHPVGVVHGQALQLSAHIPKCLPSTQHHESSHVVVLSHIDF